MNWILLAPNKAPNGEFFGDSTEATIFVRTGANLEWLTAQGISCSLLLGS
jgi:hypothetical protein